MIPERRPSRNGRIGRRLRPCGSVFESCGHALSDDASFDDRGSLHLSIAAVIAAYTLCGQSAAPGQLIEMERRYDEICRPRDFGWF